MRKNLPSNINYETALTLTKCAADKLNILLTDLGHPLHTNERVNSLAKCTGVSKQVASNLLSGIVPWMLDDIALLCNSFGKPPGFFLDQNQTLRIPADSSLVTSADAGESTVWRAPSGFLMHPRDFPNEPLHYISTTANGFFDDSIVRVMLIYEDWTAIDANAPVKKNFGYIIEDSNETLQAVKCIEVNEKVAVFASLNRSTPNRIVVPLQLSSNVNTGSRLVGRAIGAIQGF